MLTVEMHVVPSTIISNNSFREFLLPVPIALGSKHLTHGSNEMKAEISPLPIPGFSYHQTIRNLKELFQCLI